MYVERDDKKIIVCGDRLTEKPEDNGMDSKSSVERDRIDLNREIAGVSTSRIQRFLSDDSFNMYGDSEKKKSERQYRSMLEILLTEDAQYKALYTKVTKNLENAYQAVDSALININQRIEDSDRKLQFMRDNAPELADGTKVFKSAHDNGVYTEDGKCLNDANTQNITFSNNSPNWEEFKSEKETFDTATHQKTEVETYKHDVLDHAKERLNDEDNPALMDELEDIQGDIESKMPDLVKETHASSDMDNTQHESPSQEVPSASQPEFVIPSLGSY